MLSKSDLFKYMVPKAPSYRFLSNAVYRSSVDLQDAREIHKEVRSIIEDSRERTLLRLIQKFSKVNFFATSATGCKVEDNGAFQFIDPCRCLDPILWIFHQLGIVQSFDEN